MSESAPLYFVHITDTHLNAPENESFMKLNTTANLNEIFAHVRSLAYKPAFVVITGDLAHEGNAADYSYIKQLLDAESEALGAPIFVTLGNHDHRDAFNAGYLNKPNTDRPYYFVQNAAGLRVFILDSHYPGHSEGLLDAEQLTWLHTELAVDATPALICVHHPPHTNSFFANTDHLLTNSADFAAAIAGYNVIGILSGHIHFNSIATFHGVLSAAGQGSAFGLDSTERTGMRLLAAHGYNLGIIQNGTLSLQPFSLPSDRRELMFVTFDDIKRAHYQQISTTSA
jgi:3',5'-cyclic AMP phosphodiesterase CpdA